MQVVYARCAGLDVHQKTVSACASVCEADGKKRQQVRCIGSFTGDLLALADWLREQDVTHVAMEATGADAINSFYREYLNPYLNYHRPCAQADVEIDEKGRKRVRYKRYQTPLETLLRLDKPAQYLRQGLSINALKRIASALSDTDAARRMQQAKSKLFEKLRLTA